MRLSHSNTGSMLEFPFARASTAEAVDNISELTCVFAANALKDRADAGTCDHADLVKT
jgi:hypothetical protein